MPNIFFSTLTLFFFYSAPDIYARSGIIWSELDVNLLYPTIIVRNKKESVMGDSLYQIPFAFKIFNWDSWTDFPVG